MDDRAELVKRLRSLHLTVCSKAADMLEADAKRIEELEADLKQAIVSRDTQTEKMGAGFHSTRSAAS